MCGVGEHAIGGMRSSCEGKGKLLAPLIVLSQHCTSHNTQAPAMQAMIFIVHSNLSNCFLSWKKRYLICALFGKARSEARGASHFPYTTSSCLRSHAPQQRVPHNTQEPLTQAMKIIELKLTLLFIK